MTDLTQAEALQKHEEYKQFLEMYHDDGTPKLMPVYLEGVKLEDVLDDKILITDKWSKENQELLGKLIKWAETIKYIYIVDFDYPYVRICDTEIERLADMVGGKTYIDFLILPNGEKYEVMLSHRNRENRGDRMSLKDRVQPYWLSIDGLGHNLSIVFKCNLILDEVRKNYELSKKLDELIDKPARLK